MSKFKVVLTDYIQGTFKYEQEVLKGIDAEIIPFQCKTEEELIEACKDADGILNTYSQITRKVIESLERCKIIARYGVGVNTIDVEAATDRGICVTNVPDYCVDEVSDTALSLLLASARKIVFLERQVKAGGWDYKLSKPIYRLRGKVLGLVGFGRIPRALAKKAKPLGLEIIAYDPYLSNEDNPIESVKFVGLEELLKNSDYVSLHAPLNKETFHLIGAQELKLMKAEAILINTSRGSVVDEEALADALKRKVIAGAALDVMEQEPTPIDNPLLKMDNVIINPHAAWYSQEAEVEMQTKAAKEVAQVLQGFFPKYLVNAEVKNKLSLKELKNE